MANLKNLRPFQKGTSGNPKGRKKGVPVRAAQIRKILRDKIDITNPLTGETFTGTVEYQMELALVIKAINGDVAAYKEIKDTVYGKLPNTPAPASDEPLRITIEYAGEVPEAVGSDGDGDEGDNSNDDSEGL